MRGGLLWVLLSVGFVSTAAAQSSGGAFGGSRGFGGGGSSSSSSSSWSSSSSSSSSTSYDTTSTEPEETAEERAAREAAAAAWEAEQRRQERLRQDRRVPPRERARLERYFGSERLERPHEVVPHASERELAEHEVGERDSDATWHSTIVPGADDEGDTPHWPLALGVWLGLWVGLWLIGRWREGSDSGRARGPSSCEVRRISLAFDWTERVRLQQALDALSRRDTTSVQGMYAVARQTLTLLGRAIDSARYATISRQVVGAQKAERRFFTLCQELESRYRFDRTKGDRARRFEAKAEEGEGLVVISFVMGCTRPIGDVPRRYTKESLLSALESCARVSPHELVALKVIWSPAAESDRMSSLELETIYPELMALGDTGIGKHRCGHCGALRAAEIEGCPACGADG